MGDRQEAGVPVAAAPSLRGATGTSVLEIDLMASHFRQLRKYAMLHNLECPLLIAAWRDVESIRLFRRGVEGIAPSAVKECCNMLAYGKSGANWIRQHGLPELPKALRDLKGEARIITEHVSTHAPQKWKMATAERQRPELTMLSMQCQITERQDLDRCLAVLGSLPLGLGAV
jgi:hypothetical protein